MSELVTVSSGVTGTIYGTYAAAQAYIAARFGEGYTAWTGRTDADKKRTLISAADYLNTQVWVDAYDTFAERDALQAFVDASYELAVLIGDDPDLVQLVDQGTNVARVYAGGAGVDYANPTSSARGTATLLPPILMRLIGAYLGSASSGASAVLGGSGVAGAATNPLSECSDYDRTESW